jgi:protein-tyrosine-phosphatase
MLILCVCTGNTCRSPMAAALLKQALDKQGRGDILVESAGLAAMEGQPASPQAIAALAEWDLDLSCHRSRPLTPELARQAHKLVAMTPEHAAVLTFRLGVSPDNILVPGHGVSDPYGGDLDTYRSTRDQLKAAMDTIAAQI